METLPPTCPVCGAAMTLSADGSAAECVFCGHLVSIREKDPKTEMRKTIRRIRAERARDNEKTAPIMTPSVLRGGIAAAIWASFYRWEYRFRTMGVYLVFVFTAVFAVGLIRRYLPGQYYPYLPVAAAVLIVVGIVCAKLFSVGFRSVPLGIGVGALVFWLMQLTGTLR